MKVAKEGTPTELGAQLRLGRTLFRAGERQAGGGLVQQLLNQHMEDPLALHAYGELALELGQTEDALKVFLRLITQKSEDKAVRALLARSLKAADGVPTLLAQLPPDKSSASADRAFLATVVKEGHSGVDARRRAVRPRDGARAGVGVVRRLNACASRSTQGRPRRPPSGRSASSSSTATTTRRAPSRSAARVRRRPAAAQGRRARMARMPQRGASTPPPPPPPVSPPRRATAARRARWRSCPTTWAAASSSRARRRRGRTRARSPDLLALFFTGVKVLYCLGAVEARSSRCSACSSRRAPSRTST